jgi:hypothetical protein
MSNRSKNLNHCIDRRKYASIKDILSSSKRKLINNGCSNENTLNRLIKSIFCDKDIKPFDPEIINLMFIHGAKCVWRPSDHNTLNIVIIWSGRYIESFEDDEEKLLAEQNAIKVIGTVIDSGARALNDDEDTNTLSIAMNCANIKILKCLINTNLELKPSNHIYSATILNHVPYDYTLYCAFKASEKTKNPEFLKIALINGALPYYDASNLLNQILNSKLLSVVDFIVFGGDNFIRSFFSNFIQILSSYLCLKKSRMIIEIFEMFACVGDPSVTHIIPPYHIRDKEVQKIVIDHICLITRNYLGYDENSDKYKQIIKIKHRYESLVKWLVETAMVHDKFNKRKTMIENVLLSLPISCTDIIAEYEYVPRFNAIDWSKY